MERREKVQGKTKEQPPNGGGVAGDTVAIKKGGGSKPKKRRAASCATRPAATASSASAAVGAITPPNCAERATIPGEGGGGQAIAASKSIGPAITTHTDDIFLLASAASGSSRLTQEARVSINGNGALPPKEADPLSSLPAESILSLKVDGGCDTKSKRTVPSAKVTF